ncbi:inactive ubiquitin carboxyl-terminal hydrolase MINDY-4B [Pogoniulus pusillus]|uniref:inactive ubiquitin carboxyl-terminal hydrolase MINDY-4B n=1 Tax=Pogoniulus pusillus TaxID=488313 RepID=UPI0030B927DD
MAQTQLEEIASRISDLSKWRDIFSFHGWEISNATAQVTASPRGDTQVGFFLVGVPHQGITQPHIAWQRALQGGKAGSHTPLSTPWPLFPASSPPGHSAHPPSNTGAGGNGAQVGQQPQGDDVPSALSVQPGQSSTGDGAPAAGEPRALQPPHPACAVPTSLLVPVDTGGWPISLDMAMGLRKLLFGNVSHVFSCQWAKAHFRFHQPSSDLAYGLEADKGGTRAILMAVQAHIIRHLLFDRNTAATHLERLQGISRREQGEALAAALAQLLWAAGGGGRAVVCLLTAAVRFVPRGDYRADSFTERIQLFEFPEKAAAQEFISDHIDSFRGKGSHGLILFLYSLLFSRTLERVQEDLEGTANPLLELSLGSITCTQAMLSLLLTGRASPHQLDSGQEPGPGGTGSEAARRQRALVGYLRWSRAQAEPQVPPGLRTPQVPVWLCSLCGRHGVLFGTNRLLLSCWRAERVFHLHFYSGQQEQPKPTQLTIADVCIQQTLIHTTGKSIKVKIQVAQGRDVHPWRWPSGPSGQVQLSAGMGQSPSSEGPSETEPF